MKRTLWLDKKADKLNFSTFMTNNVVCYLLTCYFVVTSVTRGLGETH